MSKSALILLSCILFLVVSCDNKPTENQVYLDPIHDFNFSLPHVQYEKLYKNRLNLYNTNNPTPQDENGVMLFEYHGGFYYHPVNLCYNGLEALNDYYMTGNPVYLNHAITTMETLRRESTRYRDMIYFPYKFDFNEGTSVYYSAPWFSGMAQGTALSAYCRLYYFTQDPLYSAVADSILNTLTDFTSPYSTVLISDNESLLNRDNYYWIDEYPHLMKRWVLNGGIIGAMGLYDHWWVFGDDQSRKLFSRKMTSIKDNVLLYRNPNACSSYDLKFRTQNTFYHGVHQSVLKLCSTLTNDIFFSAIADLFYADYH